MQRSELGKDVKGHKKGIFAAFAAQFSRHGDREMRTRKHRVSTR